MSIDNAIDNTNNAIVKPQSDNIYVFMYFIENVSLNISESRMLSVLVFSRAGVVEILRKND